MKLLFAAILVAASANGFAQTASVGVLDDIQGLVSVSTSGKVSNVTQASNLQNASVVLTSENGSGVVRMNDGCRIVLKPNQILTVDKDTKCPALIASVKTVGTPVAESAAGAGVNPLLIAAGVVGGALFINNVTKNKASGS